VTRVLTVPGHEASEQPDRYLDRLQVAKTDQVSSNDKVIGTHILDKHGPGPAAATSVRRYTR